MPKFGASVYCISRYITENKLTPEQAVEWLCENGAEVVEIVPFGIDLLAGDGLAEKLRAAAAKYGVGIDNYSLNANFLMVDGGARQAEIARTKSHIDAATALGVSTFRCDCAAYRRPVELNNIETFIADVPVIVSVYEELCAHAETKGITVLLENHGFHVNGGDRVRYILKNVKARNFGHQLDTGNYACVDDIPEVTVRKMLEFAVTLHMKDFYMRSRDSDPGDATQFDCAGAWFRSSGGRYLRGSILGQGDMDIRGILRDIKASGFDGNIYVEYEGLEECFYGTRVSLDNLKRLYAEV